MVYRTTLKLPGEYFTFEDPIGCPRMFIEKLRERMRKIRGPFTAHHTKKRTFLHKNMKNCTPAFVVDHPKRPLELSYEDPFPIITKLSDFIYRFNYKGHPEEINTDRLKPALIKEEAPTLSRRSTPFHPSISTVWHRISSIEYGKQGRVVRFVNSLSESLVEE
ncbi:PREDICTED: uncharacterized protein LOC108753233 [Trachymyrmex septentrionalis]|nr:PREDICTED: uncharacterized protein LOC108753233 [Trachymyrmex septentrionalis]